MASMVSFSSSSLSASRPSPSSRAFVLAGSSRCRFGSRRSPAACKMIEPLKSSNGAASCIPVIRDPGLLTGPPVRHRGSEPDTRLRVFSGTANPALAQEIANYLGLELGKIKIKRFADGEIYVQLQENERGCDVFLVQPTCPPANENLMELLIMIDACRRASAKKKIKNKKKIKKNHHCCYSIFWLC